MQYQREHFASDDGALRVTLDYNITCYDQTGKGSISTSFPRRLERLVVIEGKTPIGREGELRRLFYPFRARAGPVFQVRAGMPPAGSDPGDGRSVEASASHGKVAVGGGTSGTVSG